MFPRIGFVPAVFSLVTSVVSLNSFPGISPADFSRFRSTFWDFFFGILWCLPVEVFCRFCSEIRSSPGMLHFVRSSSQKMILSDFSQSYSWDLFHSLSRGISRSFLEISSGVSMLFIEAQQNYEDTLDIKIRRGVLISQKKNKRSKNTKHNSLR